jgi:hypothetical protein
MSTKWGISEMVRLRLTGGSGKQAAFTDPRELITSIEQVCNSLLKMDYFKTTLQIGETVPEGLALATYDNIPVTPYKGVSRAVLPAMPQRLPRNMGIWAVFPFNLAAGATMFGTQFIPIPMGMTVLLQSQPMISDLLGQIGYEPQGGAIVFDKDITIAPNSITAVSMQLVVLDMTQYGDYDILPLSADMEADAVEQVYQRYAPEKPPVRIDDPIAVPTKPAQP